MADKKPEIVLERTYNVPLRREYQKAPRWNRTKKAVAGLRKFLTRHMKSEKILLSTRLNNELWKHGLKNPPHHIKVTATKDKEGVVQAQLFGVKEEPKKEEVKRKEVKKEETAASAEISKEEMPAEKQKKVSKKKEPTGRAQHE